MKKDLGFNPKDIVNEVITYLINNCTLDNGLLAEKVDIKENRIVNNNHNLGELGDYSQYIAWAGKLLDKKEYIDYAIDQVKIGSELYQLNNGLFNLNQKARFRSLSEMDLYIGLGQLYILTGKQFIGDTLNKFYDGLFNDVIISGTLIPTAASTNFVVPIANPMDNGNHIELLGELFEHTGKEIYFKRMIKLAKSWTDNKNFNKHNIFLRENTNWIGTLLSKTVDILFNFKFFRKHLGKQSYCSKISKQNTHLLFGLLKYYKITGDKTVKDIFNKWLHKIDKLYLHQSGMHYGIYDL